MSKLATTLVFFITTENTIMTTKASLQQKLFQQPTSNKQTKLAFVLLNKRAHKHVILVALNFVTLDQHEFNSS
jgi:F0F1-type ATP synthase membrane subunit a